MAEVIKSSDLFRLFLRCFFVQGSWSFKCLIGLGFCYSAIPIAKRLYKDPGDQREFLRRHLTFFNAHPYYASWGLGAVAKLEEEAERKEWVDLNPIAIFKERMSGPLGAIGDRMFWSGIKPLAAGIGIWLALSIGWPALPIFLLIYNIPHIYIRAKGLMLGYRKGFDMVSNVSLRRSQKWFNTISIIGILVAGLTSMAAAKWCMQQDITYLVAFVISLTITLASAHFKKPINLVLLVSIAVSMGITLLF